ncbi:MAG: MBL fold metallo-hydrolase [Bryobacterales bacterium]|nr:MBL fold metallo-hydrolase [Bryobacterales bacterium]
MCLIRAAIESGISRRKFFRGAGPAAALPFLSGARGAFAAQSQAAARKGSQSRFRTQIVLLGSAGGPAWWPDSDRAGTSSALVVGDTIYVIDLGLGAAHRLAEAFNSGVYENMPGGKVQKGYPDFLRSLRALFFTHLHMDHTADYPALLLCGQSAGLNTVSPLLVYGPGNRGMLEEVYTPPGVPPRDVPVVNPENPTPGTVEMTGYLFQAYSQSINNFMRDNAWADFRKVVKVHDIPLPFIPGFVNPNATPAPRMNPFTVYQDDMVSVQATLVNHAPVFPSFGFRFDTEDGSVVFSGDTGFSENLIQMSQGADILVHEVIDPVFIDLLFPEDRNDAQEALRHHLLTAHTTIEEVGEVAEAAGVGTLVLNHIVPGNDPIARLQRARRNFPGRTIVGEDLMRIGVSKAK